MGLADVQLTLAVVCGVKAVAMAMQAHPIAAVWLAAALTRRPWAAAVAASVSSVWLGGANHTTLILWVGLAVTVLRGDDVRDVLRVLAVCVYLFASANKLTSGMLITSAEIYLRTPLPWLVSVGVAVGTLAGQLWMVWAVSRRDWTALPLAVALHVPIVVLMAGTVSGLLDLAVFNGLMIWLVWVTTRTGSSDSPRRRHVLR